MKKVLLPVDGSDCALRATQYVINNLQHFAAGPELHLLNVQPSLPSDVGRFINADDLKHYHQDEAKKELQSVRSILDTAGVKYQVHIVVGDPAQSRPYRPGGCGHGVGRHQDFAPVKSASAGGQIGVLKRCTRIDFGAH